VKSKGTFALTILDCANDVPAMAKFAMARSAMAVIRFMTVSPFSEALNSDRLQSVKRIPLPKSANIRKLFLKSKRPTKTDES
jgi:hypothetical protein